MTENNPDAPTDVLVDQVFAELPIDTPIDSRWKFAEVELDLHERTSDRGAPLAASVGLSINDTLWDGKPFPWFTSGPMKIDLSRRDVATITLTIPVKLTAKPPG